MDNQHKKIKGYRDLNQKEIDLMNRIKEHGEVFGSLIKELEEMRTKDANNAAAYVSKGETPTVTFRQLLDSNYAVDRAKEHLKTGVMWLVRSVAIPGSF